MVIILVLVMAFLVGLGMGQLIIENKFKNQIQKGFLCIDDDFFKVYELN